MFYFLFILASIYTIFTFWFALSSFREKALRPGILGLTVSLMMAIALFLYAWATSKGLLSGSMAQTIQLVFGIILALFTISMFIPLGRNPKALSGTTGMAEGTAEKFNQKDTPSTLPMWVDTALKWQSRDGPFRAEILSAESIGHSLWA
jgi:hypothetical protein